MPHLTLHFLIFLMSSSVCLANEGAGLVGGFGIVIAVIIAIFVLILAASYFLLSFVSSKHKSRAITIFTLAWISVILGFFIKDNVNRKWRQNASEACHHELQKLPSKFSVDGFSLETPALLYSDILFLLSERHLKFIEIKVNKVDHMYQALISQDAKDGSYAHIKLGVMGDKNCVSLPHPINGLENKAPFLPDTCITITYSDKPFARYSLELQSEHNVFFWKYGRWVLTDRQSGKNIASLTTTDTFKQYNFGTINPHEHRYQEFNCSIPATLLSQRISGIQNTLDPSPKVLERDEFHPKIDIIDVDSNEPQKLPGFRTELMFDLIKKDKAIEDYTIQLGDFRGDEWAIAIEQAKKTGWGNDGEGLVDWENKKYLHFKDSSIEKYKQRTGWNVKPLEDGFIAINTQNLWDENNHAKLIRYQRDGSVAWSVKIDNIKSTNEVCKNFNPKKVFIDGAFLALVSTCTQGKDEFKVSWKVPLHLLSAK